MGEKQALDGNAGDRKGKRVLLVDNDAVIKIERRRSKWMSYTIMSLMVMTAMLLSALLGAWMNSRTGISQEQRVEEAAKLLGIPLNGKSLAGITFVSSNGPRSSMTFTHACLNCGYEGMAMTLTYPQEPGVGWRKHDAPILAEALGLPLTASAQELK